MLSANKNREGNEGLLIDQKIVPLQIESDNPFMVSQEYDFLLQEMSPSHSFEATGIISDSVDDVEWFRNRQIELGSARLEKMPNSPHTLVNLGLTYLNNGDHILAVDYFRKALEIKGDYFPALGNLAKAYFLMGKPDKALEIYNGMLEKEPNNIKILNNIAGAFFAKKEFEKANDYLERILKLDRKNIAALNNIGTINLIKKEVDKAIHFYRKALAVKGDTPGVLNNLGVCFGIQRSYKKAIKHFLASLHINRKAVGTVLNLSQAFQEVGAYEKAIEILSEYLTTEPDDQRVRDMLAWSYASIKDYKSSLKQLRISLEKAESSRNKNKIAELFNNIATIYFCMKDYQNAEKSYLLCIENNGIKLSLVLSNIIYFYFQINKDETAKKLIDYGLEKFPKDPVIREFLGQYYFERGEYNKASEELEKVISIKPDLIDSYAMLSIIAIEKLKDYEKAERILKEGIHYNPDNPALLNNLAYNYLMEGNIDQGRQILDKIKDQNFPILLATRGLLLLKEKNLQEGRRLYNLAISSSTGNKLITNLIKQKKYLEIAKFYIKEGNKFEAVKKLKTALKIKVKYKYYLKEAEELLQTVI